MLKESRLSVLAVKDVAPRSSLELHWCKGMWKEKEGSECVVQVSCMPCNTARMILALPPKHSLFSCNGKSREEIDFLSVEFLLELLGMHRKSVRAPLQRSHSCPSDLAPAPLSHSQEGMSQHRPLPHPLHMAMSLQHPKRKHEELKRSWLQTAIYLESQAAFLQSQSITLCHTDSVGNVARGWVGCIRPGRVHRAGQSCAWIDRPRWIPSRPIWDVSACLLIFILG